jgi:N-acetylglucosamine-6-phosphate deacetylase
MAEIIDHPPSGAFVAGIHMEGPWISRKRSGGIRAESCYPVTQADVERYQSAARGHVRMVTLAPEEGEALALIPWLTSQGIIVSLGHTDADYATVCEAAARGLSHATHTYNAMRPLHQREPGALGAALELDEITAQLIADGFHVHPAAIRILIRAKGTGRVCLVSDAVFAAGLPPGQYEWDGRVVERIGQTCRFPGGAPAGSAMLVNQMLRVLVEQVGLPFEDAVRMGSETPARVLGMHTGRLAPGYKADVVVLKEDYEPSLTVIDGEIVYQKGIFQLIGSS